MCHLRGGGNFGSCHPFGVRPHYDIDMFPGFRIIDDILKGLPENARLRSQLGELRSQNEKLQAQLKDANLEIARLSKHMQPDIGLDEQAIKMLVALANKQDATTSEALAARLGLPPAKGGFHFDQLVTRRFVIQRACSPDGDPVWEATASGRSYLAQKRLL